jgi:hypothetical protein
VDEETKRYLEATQKSVETGFSRLEGKVDAVAKQLHDHVVESAVRWKEVDARARSAHHRMDAHLTEHQRTDERRFQSRLQGRGMVIAAWVAIGTTIVTLVVTIILAFYK